MLAPSGVLAPLRALARALAFWFLEGFLQWTEEIMSVGQAGSTAPRTQPRELQPAQPQRNARELTHLTSLRPRACCGARLSRVECDTLEF